MESRVGDEPIKALSSSISRLSSDVGSPRPPTGICAILADTLFGEIVEDVTARYTSELEGLLQKIILYCVPRTL